MYGSPVFHKTQQLRADVRWNRFPVVQFRLEQKPSTETCYFVCLPAPRNYGEILKNGYVPGRDILISYGDSRIDRCLLVAPCGGGIEPGSSEIMRAVAEIGGWAWYDFAGFLPQGNRENLRIADTNFDEPALVTLLPVTPFAVVFHGSNAGSGAVVHIGGLLDAGRAAILHAMTATFKEHEIQAVDVTERQEATHLQGLEPSSLANRGKLKQGIQLAFSREARNLLFPPNASREARGRRSSRLSSVARSINSALEKTYPVAAAQLRQK